MRNFNKTIRLPLQAALGAFQWQKAKQHNKGHSSCLKKSRIECAQFALMAL